MKAKLGFISIILFAAILVFSVSLHRTYGRREQKIFYVPPYNYVNTVTGNFKSLAADMFLIRGILSVAEEEMHSLYYVLDNLRLAAQLNPKLTYAYIVGGIVAPRGNEELPIGIQFLKEGMERLPADWRLPFWIGFNYLQLGDNLKAAEYYRLASTMSDAPNYLKSMTARYYYEANRPDIALLYLEGIRNTIKDSKLLQNIEIKIEWLKNIVFLQNKVNLFYQKYGYWPADLAELVKAELIDKIPQDPFGKGYQMDEEWYKNPGRVRSKF